MFLIDIRVDRDIWFAQWYIYICRTMKTDMYSSFLKCIFFVFINTGNATTFHNILVYYDGTLYIRINHTQGKTQQKWTIYCLSIHRNNLRPITTSTRHHVCLSHVWCVQGTDHFTVASVFHSGETVSFVLNINYLYLLKLF